MCLAWLIFEKHLQCGLFSRQQMSICDTVTSVKTFPFSAHLLPVSSLNSLSGIVGWNASMFSIKYTFCCTGVISLTRMLSQWAALILWRGGQRLQSATHLAVSDMWGTCEVPPQETMISGDPKRLKLECNTEWKYILSCIHCNHWVWPSGECYFLYKCQDENKKEIYSYIYVEPIKITFF